MSEAAIEELLEEIGLVHHVPGSLLLGRGGIRNAEVAMTRKVAYWVLRRRGMAIDEIAALFSRSWQTILAGLRWMDRELTSQRPPEWALDIYPLAGIGFDDLLRWAIKDLDEVEQGYVRAYCHEYSGGALRGNRLYPLGHQIGGLRLLATRPRLRRAVAWAFQSTLDTDPSWSIKWRTEQLGYRYVA